MNLVNLKDHSDTATFQDAVKRGLGKGQGLYFMPAITAMDNIDELLAMPLTERSIAIIKHLTDGELADDVITDIVNSAFNFPAPVVQVDEQNYCLELFHGPTLAFKDFGGRFMAQCLTNFTQDPVTILTATSGDTGAAVAAAFHGIENINVVILFPQGKISPLQEKLFTTLGDNIHTVAVEADFDACQAMVKHAFDDIEVREGLHLNSANSINIARLLAQVCYYFEAYAQLDEQARAELVIAVPSGNFGNLTAGIIAKVLGLPIKRFVAATNLNDTVPRYLQTGQWDPKATIATLSNAMDVSQPNNWPRIQHMLDTNQLSEEQLTGVMVDEDDTQLAMKSLQKKGYISEPHAAVAYRALQQTLQDGETGLFLGTAHPAKFRESVENILGQPISLPKALSDASQKASLAVPLPADYAAVKAHMFDLLGDK